MSEAGYLGARGGGVDLMVAMNPQTWTQDVASIVPGGYLFYDNTKPMPPSKFRDDIVVIGVPLTEITNKAYTESRQRQLFKNIVYLGALSALLQMDVAEIETAAGRAVPRPRQAGRGERAGAAHGPRLGAGQPAMPDRADVAARRRCGRSHLHRGQRRRRARRGVWRRHSLRVVSDHAVFLAGRGIHPLLQPLSGRPADQEEQVRHRPGRGRIGVDRHGDRRRVERRTGIHRDFGAGHLADAGICRLGIFRGNPCGDLRRAARRPVYRHADSHAADRHTELRLCFTWRHQARAAVPGRSARVLRIRCAVVRPCGSPADADLHDARSRDRHERPAVRTVRLG